MKVGWEHQKRANFSEEDWFRYIRVAMPFPSTEASEHLPLLSSTTASSACTTTKTIMVSTQDFTILWLFCRSKTKYEGWDWFSPTSIVSFKVLSGVQKYIHTLLGWFSCIPITMWAVVLLASFYTCNRGSVKLRCLLNIIQWISGGTRIGTQVPGSNITSSHQSTYHYLNCILVSH